MSETDLESIRAPSVPIFRVRGLDVVLDSDLSRVFGYETKRLNEKVKRNRERFEGDFAFQVTADEFETLKSQIATTNVGRGGRRSPPWVFTEHGVVMAASVVNSEQAIRAMRLVVRVFIEVKNKAVSGASMPEALGSGGKALIAEGQSAGLATIGGAWGSLRPKLESALGQVLDTVVDHKRQTTVREEAQHLISESIQNLKERLAKPGLENAELAAKATKLLAEAEERKSVAAKTQAEAETIEFSNLVRKLRLLLEADRALRSDAPDAFLAVLREMGSS